MIYIVICVLSFKQTIDYVDVGGGVFNYSIGGNTLAQCPSR